MLNKSLLIVGLGILLVDGFSFSSIFCPVIFCSGSVTGSGISSRIIFTRGNAPPGGSYEFSASRFFIILFLGCCYFYLFPSVPCFSGSGRRPRSQFSAIAAV